MTDEPTYTIKIDVRLKDGHELTETIPAWYHFELFPDGTRVEPDKTLLDCAKDHVRHIFSKITHDFSFHHGNLWVQCDCIAAMQVKIISPMRLEDDEYGGISTPTKRLLQRIKREGRDVWNMTDDEILREPNAGLVRLREIRAWMKRNQTA